MNYVHSIQGNFTWLLLAYYPNLNNFGEMVAIFLFFYNVFTTIIQPIMEESTFDIVASVKQCMLLNIMLGVSLHHLRAVQRLMVHFTTNVKSVLSENLGCILGGTQC
jgi:hypothetical protein